MTGREPPSSSSGDLPWIRCRPTKGRAQGVTALGGVRPQPQGVVVVVGRARCEPPRGRRPPSSSSSWRSMDATGGGGRRRLVLQPTPDRWSGGMDAAPRRLIPPRTTAGARRGAPPVSAPPQPVGTGMPPTRPRRWSAVLTTSPIDGGESHANSWRRRVGVTCRNQRADCPAEGVGIAQ